MTSSLTQADVAKLLSEPSPTARAELAGKVALEVDNPRLNEQELRLAQDIVRVLARDVEVAVRASLAHSLRRAVRLPHDVAIRMAKDIEKVSLPILANSDVLTDEDLASIIESGNQAKQEVIAGRPNISEKISDSLIMVGTERVVATLMGNVGARISENSLQKAADRFWASDLVKEKMVRRATLPASVTERLVAMVSDNLKDYLVSHHELAPSLAADVVLQSRERAVISFSNGSSAEELEKMITQMHRNKRLTPSLVLRALCMGDISFFETAIACMAGVPVVNARILLHDAGWHGLKSLYDKTGLPARMLPAVRVAMDVVHESALDGGDNDRARYRSRVIERVLTQFEEFGPEDLDYLLDKLGDILGAAA
jgi:uncharacterized protein (DUF2336 family)